MKYTLTLADEAGIVLDIYDVCFCGDEDCSKFHAVNNHEIEGLDHAILNAIEAN